MLEAQDSIETGLRGKFGETTPYPIGLALPSVTRWSCCNPMAKFPSGRVVSVGNLSRPTRSNRVA